MPIFTTEITSTHLPSENVIHQRLLSAYLMATNYLNGNLLEIGCGNGRGLEVLATCCSEITAIDKNERLIRELSSQYRQFNFHAKTIPPLVGFRDNLFDSVSAFQVIEHIKNDELFVAEIKRVLKPGGRAIITTPNNLFSLSRNPWHIREYTANTLQSLLQRHFKTIYAYGVAGNEKIMAYHESNRLMVKKITRFDVFNLQYRLPRQGLQLPYEVLNRLSRHLLLRQNQETIPHIRHEDFTLSHSPETSLDLFYVVEK